MDTESFLPTPQGYATPEQIARSRQIAQYLMMGGGQEKKLTHPLQALGNLANSAVGNMRLNQAEALDRSSDLQDARRFTEGTQAPTPGGPTAGPASVRNNNPGAQWPGPVASQFGSSGAQDLPGGNKIASFDDPIKGGAAHFALLAQKYSGMPLGAAIAKWSGGNSAAPYAQFVSGRTGLSPETPITPELLKGPQGIALAKAMADWEAGGRYPMTDQQWMQAHQTAFGGGPQTAPGGPQTGGGEEAGGDSQALGFSGEPAEGGGNDAMGGIVSALQAPKTGAPPVPGGPVTRAPLDAAQPGNGIPPGVLPHRIPMSREALINTLASRRLDPNVKNTALQLYLEQTQPMQMQVPGGTMNIAPGGQTMVIPQLFQGKAKAGDVEMPIGYTYPWDPKNPNAIRQEIAPTSMGGGGGGPGGPLGTPPPSAQAGGNVVPDVIRKMKDYSQEQSRISTYKDEDLKSTLTKIKESTDLGLQAERSVPVLKQMRHMIEDKRLQQSIGSDLVLDWNRIKAFAGSKGGERAAALMQAFDKMSSGQIVSDLKTQLQGTGQIRVKEIELVEKASASRYNTREANRAVLELMIRSNEQMAGLGKATAEYLAEHKHNSSIDGLILAKQKWLEEHPMLNAEEIKDFNKKFDADPRYPEDLGEGPKGKKNAAKPAAIPPTPTWGGGAGPLPPGWTPE